MQQLRHTTLQVTLAGPRKKSLDELARAGDPETSFLIPSRSYLDAVARVVGPDLDICSTAKAQLHIGAQSWFNIADAASSLSQPWFGRCYAPLHPNRKLARAQLNKLLRDYLSERVDSALVLLRSTDLFHVEPILLSFPLVLHYKRLAHSRWNPDLQCYERHWPSFTSSTLYLPARAGATICDRRLTLFTEALRSFGRPILPENLVPDWEADALLATAGARPQPFLLRRSPDRVPLS